LAGNRYHPTAPPSQEYLALAIRNRKVVPVRKFTVPNAGENWQFLSDGSVLFADGALYSPDGKKGGAPGWQTYLAINSLIQSSIGAGRNQAFGSILWNGDVRIQYKGTPPAGRCRIFLPHSGRSIPIAADIVKIDKIMALLPSEDGSYLLSVNLDYDFSSTAVGTLARRLNEKVILPDALKYKAMEGIRFELYEPAGKKRAVLSGRFIAEGIPYIAAARHRYLPINAAISPDGRSLVILAQRIDSNIREYLHFAW